MLRGVTFHFGYSKSAVPNHSSWNPKCSVGIYQVLPQEPQNFTNIFVFIVSFRFKINEITSFFMVVLHELYNVHLLRVFIVKRLGQLSHMLETIEVYNCFFVETGPAKMHWHDVILHVFWKKDVVKCMHLYDGILYCINTVLWPMKINSNIIELANCTLLVIAS